MYDRRCLIDGRSFRARPARKVLPGDQLPQYPGWAQEARLPLLRRASAPVRALRYARPGRRLWQRRTRLPVGPDRLLGARRGRARLEPEGLPLITDPNGYGLREVLGRGEIFLRETLQKFTVRQIDRLLHSAGLTRIETVNSIFIFSVIFGRSVAVARFDERLADALPNFASSGWYFLCRKAA